MPIRSLVTFLLVVLGLVAGPGLASASRHERPPTGLVVAGVVAVPTTYDADQLRALPQTTLTDQRPGRGSGQQVSRVLLQTLVLQAQPQLPSAKNPALRVVATVVGRHRSVATALGELDPGFGNHPALLVLARDGRPVCDAPELIFPGDTDVRRTVTDVHRIDVTVAPTAAVDVLAGTLRVSTDRRTVPLTTAELAALPQQARTVTFLASGVPQTRTETGPTLAAVLRTADVRPGPATSVAATGVDGYVATVTPGESTSGGRPMLVSLVEDGQPLTRLRLVPAGDVRGGRYVSDLTTLTVTGPPCRR